MMMCSRSNGLSDCVKPTRGNGDAALTAGASLDLEPQPFEDRSKAIRAFGRLNPYDQNTCRSQEVHQPVECGFEGLDRILLPVDKGDVVLTARESAGRRCGDATVSAAMQLKHLVGALPTRHDDSMQPGTPG